MRRSNYVASVVLVVGLWCFVGCGGSVSHKPDDKVKVYPVEGTLIIGGRNAGNARLVFHPVTKGDSIPLYPVAVTRPDGTFRLTTYATDDGAPEGEYIVTLLWPNETIPVDECDVVNPAAHDRLSGLYTDAATSSLRATVHPRHNEITIHATVGGKGWNLPRLKDAGKKDERPPSRDRERDRDR